MLVWRGEGPCLLVSACSGSESSVAASGLTYLSCVGALLVLGVMQMHHFGPPGGEQHPLGPQCQQMTWRRKPLSCVFLFDCHDVSQTP